MPGAQPLVQLTLHTPYGPFPAYGPCPVFVMTAPIWGEARALGGTHAGGRWGPPARRRRRFFWHFFLADFYLFNGNSAYLIVLAAMLSRLAPPFGAADRAMLLN